MSKKFAAEVLKLRPTWRTADRFFFCMMPVHLIACGFAWERSSEGVYIWRYAHPLFDRGPSLSFVFGQRLAYPRDLLPIAKGGERAAASEFISRIAPDEDEVRSFSDPARFLGHVESLNSFRNPWVRRGYAMTLILAGRMTDAAAQINTLLKNEPIDDLPDFREDVSRIAEQLAADPPSALAMLRARAVQNRRVLGLDAVGDASP